jgi:site-specific DNA-methyltransferase (adenine-specific)
MSFDQMRYKDLRKEAKKRGLKRYSSLNKAQLIQYLTTEGHPLQPETGFDSGQEPEFAIVPMNQTQTALSESGLPLFPDILPEKLPVRQILWGDCLSILPSLPQSAFDCCIADPPFNMSQKKGLGWAFSSHITMQESWDIFSKDEYFQFTLDWVTEILRVVKTNGNIFVFGSFHNIFTLGFILQNIFDRRIITQIVWYKPNAQPNITCRMFTESTEFILWAVNNESKKAKNWTFNYETMKAMNNNKQMRNMWEIPLTKQSEKKHGKHPSQKPLQVVERLVLAGTNEGDLILDPFSGTGTTAVVSEKQNRKWVMIEKEEEYNQIAQKRLNELSEE